jgi:hypothetical protein
MSGGHFNYKQYEIGAIADEIESLISDNEYSPEIIERFVEAVFSLRNAEIMVQRIDYLVSEDDGEEAFIRRLDEELGDSNDLR